MCRVLLRAGERRLKHHLEVEKGGWIETKQASCNDLPIDDASSLTMAFMTARNPPDCCNTRKFAILKIYTKSYCTLRCLTRCRTSKAYSGHRKGEKNSHCMRYQTQHCKSPQATRLSGSVCKGIKIIDIFAMALLAVEMKAKPSFVKRCGETLLVLDQQAVSVLA